MTSISYINYEIVIALNRKILFVNPNDLQIFKEVEIPENLAKHGLILAESGSQNDEDKDENKSKATHKTLPVQIQHVKVSSDNTLLAVTTSGQKALLLYKCRPENAMLLSIRSISRISSALQFTNLSTILMTDKTGDCYEYDVKDPTANGKLLLGHLSIVYDIISTPDLKYIITSDRDDKIRITNYPNSYEIEGYCLGHTEYVSGIQLLPTQPDILLSISGDQSLRLWKYKEGLELAQINLPAPGIKFSLRQVSAKVWNIAALVYQPNECVFIYEISQNNEKFAFKELSSHQIYSDIVVDLCYAEEHIFLTAIKDNRLNVVVIPKNANEPHSSDWKQMVNDYFKDEYFAQPDDISGWFKKKIDNLTDYFERKKRRIEKSK